MLLRKRAAMLGRPEHLHRRTDARQGVRLGNGALHHELLVPSQRYARTDVVTEIDDLPQRTRETAAGMSVDCMPDVADLHPLRPQRYGDRATAWHRFDERTIDPRIADGNADRAATVLHRLQPSLEAVVFADETRDEGVLRVLVHLFRGVELLDPAPMKYGDPIGHRERLGLVMGDVDHRHAEPLMEPPDLELHLLAQLLVQCSERFVHQDQLGLEYERACYRHALLLAAGELST